MSPVRKRIQFICVRCDSTYERRPSELRKSGSSFCSNRCKRDRVSLTCGHCGKAFERKKGEVRHEQAFCSRQCYVAAKPLGPGTYPKIGQRHAHRVIAERKLGRPLLPGEVVHHKDGDKHNFEHENIEILDSQSEHAQLHRSRTRGRFA